MKKFVTVVVLLLVSAAVLSAQEGAGVRGQGTVNRMSPTPDQNQQLNGQRPNASGSGQIGDAPDNTDRVNGRAFPMQSGVTGPATASQGPGSATDPRSGKNVPDAAMQKAAQASRSGALPERSLNPSESPQKAVTASPGAKAKTKATTGGQTNDTGKRQ